MPFNETTGRPSADAGTLPGGRSLYVLVGVQSAVEFAVWVTVLVVAYARGGASATGLAVAAQLVPAALLAPIVTAAGDRFPRHLVLSAGFAVLGTSAAALTVALAAELPLAAVYAAAAAFTVALSATPGSIASVLGHHARSPLQLVHWNVGMTIGRAAGSLAGPLVTGLVLATTAPWVAAATVAATCAATAAVVARRLPRDDRPPSDLRLRQVITDSLEGLRYAVTTPATAAILGFMGLVGVTIGAYDVVLLGHSSQIILVVGLIALLGAGHALVEIGAKTILQRASAETFTSRVFGVLDSTILVASSIGATVVGILLADADLTAVLVPLGLVAAAVLTVAASSLRRRERAAGVVDPGILDALSGISFLAPLPLPTLERLAGGLGRRTVPGGAPIIRQGDAGTEFLILLGVIGRVAFLEAVRRSVSSHRSALAAAAVHRRVDPDGDAS